VTRSASDRECILLIARGMGLTFVVDFKLGLHQQEVLLQKAGKNSKLVAHGGGRICGYGEGKSKYYLGAKFGGFLSASF